MTFVNKKVQENKNDIIKRYTNGESIGSLERRFGVSRTTLRENLVRWKIKLFETYDGICKICNETFVTKYRTQVICSKKCQKIKKYLSSREWIVENREKYNRQSLERYHKNPEKYRISAKKWRDNNPDKRKYIAGKYILKSKIEVFSYYSNGAIQCKCCGEKQLEFLTLDHINGRKNEKGHLTGYQLYKNVIKQNFPRGFQVLCFNCNSGKWIYKECPHKKRNELIEKLLLDTEIKEIFNKYV